MDTIIDQTNDQILIACICGSKYNPENNILIATSKGASLSSLPHINLCHEEYKW